MKKRLLMVLLVVALLVAAAVVTVQADTPAAPLDLSATGTYVCPCCGKTPAQLSEAGTPWTQLAVTDGNLAGGKLTGANAHYYIQGEGLTTAIGMSARYTHTTADTKITLLIDNCTVTTKASTDFARIGVATTQVPTAEMYVIGNNAQITGGALASTYGGLFRVSGKLTIDGDLTLQLSGNTTNASGIKGGIMDVISGGQITVKNGTFIGATDSLATKKANGGIVYVANNGTFNMSGGTFEGGEVLYGGAIFMAGANSKVNISGGTINGGAATTGGAIYQYNGVTTISGGTINGSAATKNVATGGAIYAYQGSVSMSDGTIQNGYATQGGNVYLSGVTLTMTGGTIQGGNATQWGGNVAMFYRSASGSITAGSARLNVNGGTIQNGTVTVAEGTEDIGTFGGGNVYISRACYLTVDGGTLSGGTVTGGNGGNIFSRGKTTLTSGNITGGSAPNGASIYAYCQSQESNETVHANYAKVVVTGGTLTGGTATTAGGAIYIGAYGSADITGGTVTSGTAPRGGNIYMAAGTELKISGENTKITSGVSNGAATDGGGNLYQDGGTVTMSGGTIENGTYATDCRPQGGNIRQNAGTFTMTAGTIQNGSAINLGGNARISGTFNIQGGTVYGGTVESSGGSIGLVSGTLNITGGTISGGDGTQEKNAAYGGLIYIASGTVKISGDAILENGYATNGGLIQQAGGTLTISGGTLQNGKASNRGGNIYGSSSSALPTISGGTISGGTAADGGNLYLNGGTISGATISGGTADNGGNIFQASGTLTISAGSITGGKASYGAGIFTYDGALNLVEAADKTLTVTGGEATAYGGVIYAPSSTEGSGDAAVTKKTTVTIDLTNGSITGGTAKNGAGIWAATDVTLVKGTISGGASTGNGGTLYLSSGANFTMNGGVINGGTTEAQGGVAYLPGNTVFNMTAGTINVATTGSGAKGFRIQNGTLNLSGTATINYNGLRVGDAADVVSTDENNLATVTLSGGASMVNVGTEDAAAIHLQNYSKNNGRLIVKDDWTGSATVAMEYYGTGSNAEDTITYAGTISTELAEVIDAAEDGIGAFTGELTFKTISGDPLLFNDGATLHLAKTQIVAESGDSWYKDNAAAVTAYAGIAGDKYIKLYTGDALDIGATDTYVNINGQTVAATGTGKLYAMDSTTTTSTAGTGKITGVTVETYLTNPLTGYRYIATGDATNGYTLHGLKIAVTGVSLRPSSAGIYYKATIECDDTLKGLLDQYGVAVSVVKMPNDQFAVAGSQALYTSISTDDFVSGKAFTGVIINNIMKENEATNAARAEMPIYANAYVYFDIGGGLMIMADEDNQGLTTDDDGFTGVAKDLKEVTKAVDTRYPTLTDEQKKSIATMTEKFATDMADWNLIYMASADGTPARELKVLTIGNSLSVDAGRMLAYVASQEGIEITVGTLYHSGCSQAQHVKYLKNNEEAYDYYYTHWCADEACEKIDLDFSKGGKSTMEKGILAEKWDIILTQQGLWHSADASTYNNDLVTLRNYVTGLMTDPTNPNANPYFSFGWNMNWVPPVKFDLTETSQDLYDTDGDGTPDTKKYAAFYDNYNKWGETEELSEITQLNAYRKVAALMEEKIVGSGAYPFFIPAGTLMQYANSVVETENEDLLYRDYIHASDEMRLATAYLWLYTLTGKSFDDLNMVTEVPTNQLHGEEADAEGTTVLLTTDEKALFENAIKQAVADRFGANIPDVTE